MPADHPLRSRFVLDTSLFLSEGIRGPDGDLEAAVLRLLDLVAAARVELGVSCHVPPSIHDELTTILAHRDVDEPVFSRLDTWVVRKSPARREVDIPAQVVYGFIDELSDRVDRGRRVSEDALREARMLADEGGEGDAAADADRLVSELRRKYREALRRGVLDSREDFDLLVLARELDAGVVTEDRGVLSWADEFGLRQVRGARFPTLLQGYLEAGADNPDRRAPE